MLTAQRVLIFLWHALLADSFTQTLVLTAFTLQIFCYKNQLPDKSTMSGNTYRFFPDTRRCALADAAVRPCRENAP